MINKLPSTLIIFTFFLLLAACASILKIKPISFYYNDINQRTTYTTKDIYLVERNVPPYALKLSVSKTCNGKMMDCDPDYYDLVFFSTSYPGFANHLSFIADSDTIFLGTAKRVGSEFNMSEVNAAASMLSDGELLDLISIRSDAFRKIANATRLRGYLGSQNFEITYKMRSSWRLLFEYSMLETIRAN
ncbi:MAG: hypothetical protein P8L91_00765 [Candidatus Marinimicrobia bacterium]|nr:hypothetical protein [Candidatus Neomarinimicrobiota bacterium]